MPRERVLQEVWQRLLCVCLVLAWVVGATPEAESAKRRVNPLSGSPLVAEQARHVGG